MLFNELKKHENTKENLENYFEKQMDVLTNGFSFDNKIFDELYKGVSRLIDEHYNNGNYDMMTIYLNFKTSMDNLIKNHPSRS